MPLDVLHRDIVAIALCPSAQYGFAVGGGNALIAHEMISRLTEDVDLVTDQETGVAAAADAVECRNSMRLSVRAPCICRMGAIFSQIWAATVVGSSSKPVDAGSGFQRGPHAGPSLQWQHSSVLWTASARASISAIAPPISADTAIYLPSDSIPVPSEHITLLTDNTTK